LRGKREMLRFRPKSWKGLSRDVWLLKLARREKLRFRPSRRLARLSKKQRKRLGRKNSLKS